MPYASLSGPVGNQQVANFRVPDTTARQQTGLMDFVDNYWGGAEMLYVKANGTIRGCWLRLNVAIVGQMSSSRLKLPTPLLWVGQFMWLWCL
jgi:hypothetical protein